MRADLPLPVAVTVEFLLAHLTRERRRVLEVGCGDGAVAAALVAAGHELTALDADPEMVAAARGRGIDARCVRWPDFVGSELGALVFSRSLHHLQPVDRALQKALDVLVPHGLLLIEDFAAEGADERTLRWLQKLLRELDGDGLLRNDPDLFANRLLRAADPAACWADEHAEVATFGAIEQAAAAIGRPGYRAGAPYLFRSIAPALVVGSDAEAALQRVYRDEERMCRRGEIAALGRRLVLRMPLPA